MVLGITVATSLRRALFALSGWLSAIASTMALVVAFGALDNDLVDRLALFLCTVPASVAKF
jgi:hypothetical protein